MYSLEVTRNRNTDKYVKLNALQNGYSIFTFFSDLTPKVQNIVFPLNQMLKNMKQRAYKD